MHKYLALISILLCTACTNQSRYDATKKPVLSKEQPAESEDKQLVEKSTVPLPAPSNRIPRKVNGVPIPPLVALQKNKRSGAFLSDIEPVIRQPLTPTVFYDDGTLRIPKPYKNKLPKLTILTGKKPYRPMLIGRPYKIKGITYKPRRYKTYNKVGIASWYGGKFHGRLTANGEVYDKNLMTAAHKTLPLPTFVKVTRLKNNKSIIVRVNDRGPYSPGRIIDLSRAAAEAVGIRGTVGVTKVRVQLATKAEIRKAKQNPGLYYNY